MNIRWNGSGDGPKGAHMYTELPAKLQPFNLVGVPSELDWCIDKGELKQGKVPVPAPVYKLVLVLRWLLSSTHHSYDNCFHAETRQVFWRALDEYGFCTEIWLFEPKIEDYDVTGDVSYVVQPQRWTKLATIKGDGGDKIKSAIMNLSAAFGGDWEEFPAELGMNRLFMEAAHASQATHNWQPVCYRSDGKMESWRCEYPDPSISLIFVPVRSKGYVTDLDITFRKDLDFWG